MSMSVLTFSCSEWLSPSMIAGEDVGRSGEGREAAGVEHLGPGLPPHSALCSSPARHSPYSPGFALLSPRRSPKQPPNGLLELTEVEGAIDKAGRV